MATLLAASILLGTKIFIDVSQPKPPVITYTPESIASGAFELQLVPMFDAMPDEFALDEDESSSVTVMMRGQTVFNMSKSARRGEPISVTDVEGLVEGENELYVRATPSSNSADETHAMRIRVLRDGVVLAEQWLSAEPGDEVAGPVRLRIGKQYSRE